MNFSEASQYLESRTMFGVKLGLENVRKLLEKLGNPQESLNFIHLAGTNGKGSTATLLNSALMSSGKVGMYTSPHLISVQERIRINGIPVSESLFAEAMTTLAEAVESCKDEDLEPTYFETATIIAILIFHKQKCDFIVWETGMGGRLDATNVVTPIASVITNVALDHCSYLGDTIEQIAMEKGGIIKPRTVAFYGGSDPKVCKTLRLQALSIGAPFCFRGNDFFIDDYNFTETGMITKVGFQGDYYITAETKLWGRHQADNISLAIAVLRYLSTKDLGIDANVAIKSLGNAVWPGRLQEIANSGGKCFIDGAHNPHAARGLVTSLTSRFPEKKWNIVVGILKDKEFDSFLKIIDEIAESYTVIPVNNPRTASVNEVSIALKEIAPDKKMVAGTIAEVSSYIKGDTLITGSLYLIGDILKQLVGSDLPAVIENS